MGMLAEAKKKSQKSESDKEHLKPDPKHKHKHAKPSPQVASNAPGAEPGATEPDSSGPDAEPEGNAEAPDADSAGDQEAPESSPEDGSADASDQGGAAAAQPQDPQDQSGEDASTGADQGNAPSGGAGQDQSQDAGGAQGGAPSGDASDDSASGQAGQSGQIDLSQVPISPALKEEFLRCNVALHSALYTNDKVAQQVIIGVIPSGPHKIESAARMAVLLVVQINKQLKFCQNTPQVVLPFTQDVVEQLLDLVMQVKKIQFNEQEAHAVLGMSLEMIMRIVGVNKKQTRALQHTIPRSQIMDGHAKYQQHLQNIKGAVQANNQAAGPPVPGGGQTPPAGGATPQSPAAAPAGAGGPSPAGQPQPGAPVTAAPGPGQSAPPGGMLSAAQPPQGGA